MLYMACFVIFVSYFFRVSQYSNSITICFIFMLLVCSVVFITDSLFILYLAYESSLIPILYIIIKWGSYPERSFRSIMLLVYTSFFTFPFIYVIFSLNSTLGTFSYGIIYSSSSRLVFSLVIFLTFAVKLPIYGLHFWLPMAHVEAPTFGSIILAGVLLKLGGVGIIRFICTTNINLLSSYILSYFFVFMVYVTLVCCFQSDFKRLVAYSSVSHIIGVPILLLSSSFIGLKGSILLMFFHGISSPLMFMLVGLLYSFFFDSTTSIYTWFSGVFTSPFFFHGPCFFLYYVSSSISIFYFRGLFKSCVSFYVFLLHPLCNFVSIPLYRLQSFMIVFIVFS